MNKKTIIASLVQIANGLDQQGKAEEADIVTHVAQSLVSTKIAADLNEMDPGDILAIRNLIAEIESAEMGPDGEDPGLEPTMKLVADFTFGQVHAVDPDWADENDHYWTDESQMPEGPDDEGLDGIMGRMAMAAGEQSYDQHIEELKQLIAEIDKMMGAGPDEMNEESDARFYLLVDMLNTYSPEEVSDAIEGDIPVAVTDMYNQASDVEAILRAADRDERDFRNETYAPA